MEYRTHVHRKTLKRKINGFLEELDKKRGSGDYAVLGYLPKANLYHLFEKRSQPNIMFCKRRSYL
jgi:hypothetical protein